MSEFSLAPTTCKKKTDLSTLLLSDFMLFCSFILSHPLYFSYFIFFSPYLFKIFSFLSPLFVTTTLLLLAFFTLTPSFVNQAGTSPIDYLPESKVSFLLTTYQTLVETLRSKVDIESDGFGCLEDLEVYKIMFEMSTIEIGQDPDEAPEMEAKEDCLQAAETPVDKGSSCESNQVKTVVKIFEEFLQEKEGVENLSSKKKEKEVKAMVNKTSDPKVSSANGEEHAAKAAAAMLNSQGLPRANWNTENEVADDYQIMGSSPGNFGSMRREKEWKRTLACKLFEERHNVDAGGEGMDLLWETYETDSSKVQPKTSSKKGKKSGNGCYDLDEDDYEDDSDGKLCCLQALKFSAGKMNLGMGRPNLVKISKALKGIGWLHHVSSRHGRKWYN